MKEIIENIQMLFDNKEFTLVDELLKGQGLNYSVLNCSRLLSETTTEHYYNSFIINDNEYIRYFRHFDEHTYYMIFLYVNDSCASKEDLLALLSLINMKELTYHLKDMENSKWDNHIGDILNDELVEFILKLNDYITTCGTK